jgi:hypothetical protein
VTVCRARVEVPGEHFILLDEQVAAAVSRCCQPGPARSTTCLLQARIAAV